MTSRISREAGVALGFALAFAALTLYVRFVGPIPGDRWALERAYALAYSETRSNAYQFFSGLGSPYVAAATVVCGAMILMRNVSARAAGMLVVAAAAVGIEQILEPVIGTTDAAVDLVWPAESYPSGHVVYAAATFGYLGWLARRHGRPEVTLICAVLILGMAFSRLADRSHLLNEVLGGLLLGAAWLFGLVAVAQGWSPARR